ncbi:MAG TPA: hypothetical protein VF218_05365 [Acidothermaceae bacterium]
MSTSSKEPQALTKVQFAALLIVLAICGVLALISLAGAAGKHGVCPSETQDSRPANASCFATYNNLEQTGVLGVSPKS